MGNVLQQSFEKSTWNSYKTKKNYPIEKQQRESDLNVSDKPEKHL